MTWEVLPPGVWVIFVVIGIPVYTAFLGWFLGKPRQLKTVMLGFTLFVSLVVGLWVNMLIFTLLVGLLFF